MQQTTAITSVLSPNGRFAGSIAAAKGSQIISVAVGSPCRVQLYGNAQSQTQDAARGLDVPPQAGTTQGIVTDVVLDTAPYVWTFQNCVAVNADSPQKPVLYVTLTNLDTTSDVITLALRYVPIESV